jgi:hypothetical protein
VTSGRDPRPRVVARKKYGRKEIRRSIQFLQRGRSAGEQKRAAAAALFSCLGLCAAA